MLQLLFGQDPKAESPSCQINVKLSSNYMKKYLCFQKATSLWRILPQGNMRITDTLQCSKISLWWHQGLWHVATSCLVICDIMPCDMWHQALWHVTSCPVACDIMTCEMRHHALQHVTSCFVTCDTMTCDMKHHALWHVASYLVTCDIHSLWHVTSFLGTCDTINVCEHWNSYDHRQT
jgi:hypothetical protein